MAVVLFSAASCNKNDQTWEAMQWKGLNEGLTRQITIVRRWSSMLMPKEANSTMIV